MEGFDLIITHIMGGIGNQLFQYALGRCLALKSNTELKLDIGKNTSKSSHHSYYRLDYFNIQQNFATEEDLKRVADKDDENFNPELNLRRVEDTAPRAYVPELFDSPDNIYIKGYWQREEYFMAIANILRKELTPKYLLEKNSSAWKEKILSAECAV